MAEGNATPAHLVTDQLHEHLGKARALSRAHRGLEMDDNDLDWLSFMLNDETAQALAALQGEAHNV